MAAKVRESAATVHVPPVNVVHPQTALRVSAVHTTARGIPFLLMANPIHVRVGIADSIGARASASESAIAPRALGIAIARISTRVRVPRRACAGIGTAQCNSTQQCGWITPCAAGQHIGGGGFGMRKKLLLILGLILLASAHPAFSLGCCRCRCGGKNCTFFHLGKGCSGVPAGCTCDLDGCPGGNNCLRCSRNKSLVCDAKHADTHCHCAGFQCSDDTHCYPVPPKIRCPSCAGVRECGCDNCCYHAACNSGFTGSDCFKDWSVAGCSVCHTAQCSAVAAITHCIRYNGQSCCNDCPSMACSPCHDPLGDAICFTQCCTYCKASIPL